MDDPIAKAQAAVTKQGDTVRSLKAELKEGKVEKVSSQQPPLGGWANRGGLSKNQMLSQLMNA